MTRTEFKQMLTRYNYRHKEQFDKIIVNLDATLEITIDYSTPDKVIITDKLRGYNFLTGVWSTSLKGSIFLNTFLSFFYFLLYCFLRYSVHKAFINYVMILGSILGIGWIILWTTYYIVKAESFKRLIQSWGI